MPAPESENGQLCLLSEQPRSVVCGARIVWPARAGGIYLVVFMTDVLLQLLPWENGNALFHSLTRAHATPRTHARTHVHTHTQEREKKKSLTSVLGWTFWNF